MKPLTNAEIAAQATATRATYATRTPGYCPPPVLHQVAYQGGHEIHYTGRPEDRGDATPAHVVSSFGEILTSGTYAECDQFLARRNCRRMA